MLSDDLREELAAISPSSDCDRLAELSGLFHVAGRAHLRGRGSVDVHLDVSSSTVARRAFALLRAFGVDVGDPHLPAPRIRQGDSLPAPRRGLRGRLRDAPPRRRARPLPPAAAPAAGPRRRPPLLRSRVPSRRAARLRHAERPAGPAPRDPDGGGRRRSLPRGSRDAARRRAPRPGTALSRDRLREGNRGDRRRPRRRRRRRPRARARGAGRARRDARRREPARERRPREPRPHGPCRARAARGASRASTSTRFPTTCARSPLLRLRHPTASTAELARRCKPGLSKAAAYRRLRRLQELSHH